MSKQRSLIMLGFFCAFGLALLHKALIGPEALFWHDASIDGIPLRTAAAQAVRAGHLPLWDARIGNGFSVMGETQAGVYYPPHLLCFVGIPQWRVNGIMLVSHLILAALLMALLCRVWGIGWVSCTVAGLIFGFSGWFVTHGMCIAMVEAAAWMPLTLLCLEMWLRKPNEWRWLVCGAGSLAMAGLCSYPQIFFYTFLATALYALVAAFGGRSGSWARQAWSPTEDRSSRPQTGQPLAPSEPPTARSRLPWPLLCGLGLVVVVAGGALLSAGQMLPTIGLIPDSARHSMTTERLREMALEPRHLAFFIHPYIYGSYAEGNYFGRDHQYEVCGFVGTLALVFALVGAVYGRGRGRVFAVVLVPLALFMAMARQNPLYRFLPSVPGFGYFREAGRYTLLSTLGIAFLAAMGLEAVRQSRQAAKLALALCVVGLGLALALPLGLRAAKPHLVRSMTAFVSDSALDTGTVQQKALEKYAFFVQRLGPRDPTYRMLLLCLIGCGVACGAQLSKRSRSSWVPESALALTAVQLFLFAYDYNPTVATRYYETSPPLLQALESSREEAVFLDDEWRISDLLPGRRGWNSEDMTYCWNEWELVRPNRQVLYGVRGVDAAYPLIYDRTHELLGLISKSLYGGRAPRAGVPLQAPAEVLAALGMGLFISARPDILEGLPVLKRFGSVTARRHPGSVPPVYFAEGAVVCPDRETSLRQMCAPDFRPRRVVLEPTGAAGLDLSSLDPRGEILNYRDDFGHLRIRCRAAGRAVLVVRQTWDRHFRCLVDGRPQSILHANYLFRGVLLEPGEHEVEMTYDAREVRRGAALSLVAVAGALLALLCGALRRSRSRM